MSFIITARLITRGCRSQVLSCNFNSINRKISIDKNYLKITAPWTQKRELSDKKEMKTGTDNDIEKIYSGTLASKVKIVKVFSLTTSLSSLAVQPYLIPKLIADGNIAASIGVAIFLGFFTFVTPMLLHIITKKYVIDMHLNKRTGEYIATTFTIFARRKKVTFTPNDVEKPSLGQMLTNCYVKGRPLFIDPQNFADPKHYAIIMGYDKPIDYRFEPNVSRKAVRSGEHKQTNQMNEKKSIRN